MNPLHDTILAINKTYRTLFTDAMNSRGPSPLAQRLTMTFESTKGSENYAWLTQLFGVRRWIGEREVLQGFAQEHLIRNEIYEGTVATKIQDIEDGVYVAGAAAQIRGLAAAYQRRQDMAVIDLIVNAFTAPDASNDLRTVDGKAFFATDHPWWSQETIKANGTETYRVDPDGTFSNVVTTAFSEDALWTAVEGFRLLQNHQGEPADVSPNLLVVGPKLERAARRMLTSSTVARENSPDVWTVEENEMKGMFELIVEPRFGTSERWMLFDTSSEMKPFILQNRVSPQVQMVGSFSENAAEGTIPEHVFHKDEILHGIRGRFGVGFGLPFYAYGSTAGE